jgi:hypothetical protein
LGVYTNFPSSCQPDETATTINVPPSALVIGSMAPDLPYYLPTPVDGGTTHGLAGVVGADVPLGLVAFAVWHALLAHRRPPAPLPFAAGSWTLTGLAVAACALRAALPALRDADPRGALFLSITRGGAGLATATVCAALLPLSRARIRRAPMRTDRSMD